MILLYRLLQNSGYPLQGIVLDGAAALLVELAVPAVPLSAADVAVPPITRSDSALLVRVICEFVSLLLPVAVALVASVLEDVTRLLCVVPEMYVIPEPVIADVGRLVVRVLNVRVSDPSAESCACEVAAARHSSHIAHGSIAIPPGTFL